MRNIKCLGIPMVVLFVSLLTTACGGGGGGGGGSTTSTNAFSFEIDSSIHPSPDTTDDGRGRTLPLATSKDEAGVISTFIADEVLIVPKNQAELDGFLTRTGGMVIEDNTIPIPPLELGITLSDAERNATTYVVRLDPSKLPLGNFKADSTTVGLSGKLTVSSDPAARLMALMVGEVAAGRAVGLNYLSHQDETLLRTEESPNAGGYADAFATTRFQASGSKSNVLGAWQWIRAQGMVRRVRVAILDGGFWVDGNGQPNSVAGIGTDLPANPIQYDFVNNDYRVGDANPGQCTGGNPCPWHGNSAAGAALGLVNNRAGAAGTGGLVADPMLFHITTTKGQQKWALATARAWGADVISMSFGGACNYTCRWEERIIGYDKEIERARAAGIVIVASAGNDGQNVDTEYVHPCNYDGVICVGALNDDANTPQGYSNYGGSVDIWAPTNIPVMPDPSNMSVHSYGGTSAAAPFVAGIAAMMKAVNPGLSGDQIRDIMRDTAWRDSSDSKVSHYIKAYDAVKRATTLALGGTPPEISIEIRAADAFDSCRPQFQFTATVTDPDNGPPTVTWKSDIDGVLGTGTSFQRPLSNGTHHITATAVDGIGLTTRSDEIVLSVVNPTSDNAPKPTVSIISLVNHQTFAANQTVTLEAGGSDPNIALGKLVAANVRWVSSKDGELGSGQRLFRTLSPGAHYISLYYTGKCGNTADDLRLIQITAAVADAPPNMSITTPSTNDLLLSTVTGEACLRVAGFGFDEEDQDFATIEWWETNRSDLQWKVLSFEQNTTICLKLAPSGLPTVHEVRLRGFDRTGNRAYSAPLRVTVILGPR